MKAKSIIIVFLACFYAMLISCSRNLHQHAVAKLFDQSLVLNDHFTGFALYDMDQQKMIYEQNDDQYFTPASNTKLFTFYTCLRLLGDSIPALNYIVNNDSLIFWGTGDPSFLHSELKAVKGYNFLKNAHQKLFFSAGFRQSDFYGSGWAWNDYNDDYQVEITEFPLEDNLAHFSVSAKGTLQVSPAPLSMFLRPDATFKPAQFGIERNLTDNTFVYPAASVPAKFSQEIPLKTSTGLTLALLTDTLRKPVYETHLPLPLNFKTIYDANADTVYRHMLQPSDNFMAEQLLLVCSSVKFNVLNTDSVIQYSKTHFLNDLPDAPQWVDGSGLSRYNLFTPRSIVKLLCKISEQIKNDSLLHSLLPIGGLAGTIRHAYKTDNGIPFVWAKTGSLANNHNQSGYLITRKGRRLAFSFMNNNFTRPQREIRDEMVRIITYLHDNY